MRSNTIASSKRGVTAREVHESLVQANQAQSNLVLDLVESYDTAVPPCSSNVWKANTFDTANETCIR